MLWLKNKLHREASNIRIMLMIDRYPQDMNPHKLFPVTGLHFHRLRIQCHLNIKYIYQCIEYIFQQIRNICLDKMSGNFPQKEQTHQHIEYSWKKKHISSIQFHRLSSCCQQDRCYQGTNYNKDNYN